MLNKTAFGFAIEFHLKVRERECSSVEHYSIIFLADSFYLCLPFDVINVIHSKSFYHPNSVISRPGLTSL